MPQHVYELTFMERYRGAASPTNRCNDTKSTFVPDTIEMESCEYVLLRTTKRIQYFVRVQEVYVNLPEIFLKLLPDSPEEINFLRSLKMSDADDIAFAHREYVTWVVPQSVAETSVGWEITLKKSNNQSIHNEKRFGELTGDQIAEMRAKRILLDDKLSPATPWLGEYRVRNGLSLQYPNGLEVHESPIPQLYRAFRETPQQFKKFARLVSVLFLKLTHTVEEILQLELELQESAEYPIPLNGGHPHSRYQKMQKGAVLKVRFKGQRHQYFSIRDATILEFEGICPLSNQDQDKIEGLKQE